MCWLETTHSLADTAAKLALSLPITNMKLPAGELFPLVKFCLNEWQEIWDCCEGNKLHSIYPTVYPTSGNSNIGCDFYAVRLTLL